jgi:hypothetical protein
VGRISRVHFGHEGSIANYVEYLNTERHMTPCCIGS